MCVFAALVIHHALRMRHIAICGLSDYFSTLSHKWHDLKKKKLLNIKCAFGFSLQLLLETFLILS